MALSKKTRFEIFKRDGFTCQYCGRKPPEVVLEVDHIVPKAKGGLDEELNLNTSCFDCNRGKKDRELGDVQPRPDAQIKYLELQQEMAESKQYLESRETRQSLHQQLMDAVEELWKEHISPSWVPQTKQVNLWLKWYSSIEIEQAILITSKAFLSGRFETRRSSHEDEVEAAISYVGGVLFNRAKQKKEKECQPE